MFAGADNRNFIIKLHERARARDNVCAYNIMYVYARARARVCVSYDPLLLDDDDDVNK